MPLNIPVVKELIIVCMGPVFQFIAYFILLKILPNYKDLIFLYHYSILIFNLLPVYPLDGGKLVNLIFSIKLSFRTSLYLEIFISYLTVLIIVLINKENVNINLIIIVTFLIYKITKEYTQIELLYNKFLLERYLNKYNYRNGLIINNIKSFHRDKHHLIKNKDKYYYENEFLEKFYKKS